MKLEIIFSFFENKLKVEADVAVQVSYYNECLAVWEPLLEPLMVENEKTMWEVQLKVTDYSCSNLHCYRAEFFSNCARSHWLL